MFFNLLAEAADPSLIDKKIGLGEAAIDALLGFITVFAGIAILVFIVWAVGKLMQTASGKQSVNGAAKKSENAENRRKGNDGERGSERKRAGGTCRRGYKFARNVWRRRTDGCGYLRGDRGGLFG